MAAMQKKKTHDPALEGQIAPPGPTEVLDEQAPDDELERGESDAKRRGPTVAGIGASAGGLDAIKKLLAAVPPESGIAFVLVPHLDPKHESMMVELLTRCTKMPVAEATEGMTVEADRVYVLPPNKYMTVAAGTLRLTGPVEKGGLPTSIDLFLRSLAADRLEKAICVILSGTGAHGSLGLKAVKAAGGMAIVQDPQSAEFDRMPQNAIATGLADYVLPPEQMPEAMINYARHCELHDAEGAAEEPRISDHVAQIVALLSTRTRFDFQCYRKRMLTRRIERRMSLGRFKQLADYGEYLTTHPEEVERLFHDLLISVTNFFRDPEAFHTLRNDVITPLVDAGNHGAPIRIWSAGCATGEEAYTIGILLLEQLATAQQKSSVQIFATDVDEVALEVARKGIYPENISADLTPDRMGHFFTRLDSSSYQVKKQLREIVTFARQNLIADAPFSKMDLIVCRNLLIYLEPEVQKRLIALLHFSLKPGGFLFLGSSETIARHTDLFDPVSKKWRIYRRLATAPHEQVEIPIALAPDALLPMKRVHKIGPSRPIKFAEIAHRLLLEQFAPPAVLVNRKFEIHYFFGATDRYLVVPTGEPTCDLLTMAREGLRTPLRLAIHKAIEQRSVVSAAEARVKRNGDFFPVIVTIRPLLELRGAEGLLLITFEDSNLGRSPDPPKTAAEESIVKQLEYELEASKDDLQSTIEELESSNEQLKVANEEGMSMNEELQSANEELETSKEELQSLNEELTTVNNQLQDKITDVETASNDMANLLRCTDVAIVFVDRQKLIKRFTPSATRVFNLIQSDIDRPIGDITSRFADDLLERDLDQVLRDSAPREKPLEASDGTWWNRRITIYRTIDDRMAGAVITLTDVTAVRHADDQARLLATVLLDSNDAVTVHSLDGKITAWNRSAQEMYGFSEAEAMRMDIDILVPEGQPSELHLLRERFQRGEFAGSWETKRKTKDGRVLDIWVTTTALRDKSGRPVAVARTDRDITKRKQLEREVVEIASLEQRRIGTDLHDTVGQELTALNMLAGDLAESMAADQPGRPKMISQFVQGLRRSQQDLRAVLRGLLPVAVDTEGLMSALSDLAERIGQEGKTACTFDCPRSVAVADNLTATHLYLIAQEAVHNAVKHAQPKNIRIALARNRVLTLSVEDDGIGMATQLPEKQGGLGLRIMRNRAAIIGATLKLEGVQPHGTLLTCLLELKNP